MYGLPAPQTKTQTQGNGVQAPICLARRKPVRGTQGIDSDSQTSVTTPIISPKALQPAGLKAGDRGPIGQNKLGDFRFFSNMLLIFWGFLGFTFFQIG